MPEDFDVVMWLDLSPMRLDEYLRQPARAWNELLSMRIAGQKGRADAQSEATAQGRMVELEGERKARRG